MVEHKLSISSAVNCVSLMSACIGRERGCCRFIGIYANIALRTRLVIIVIYMLNYRDDILEIFETRLLNM